MKAGDGCRSWRPALGAVVVGLLACGVVLQAAPPGAGERESTRITPTKMDFSNLRLPIMPPVHAYRVSTVLSEEGYGYVPGTFTREDLSSLGSVTAGTCSFDVQCDDCNICTNDVCDTATNLCVNTPVEVCTSCEDETFCDGREECNNAGPPLNPSQSSCIANVNPCLEVPGICNETGGETGLGACEPPCRTDAECPENDDGLVCNGEQTCVLQECVGGVAPAPGTACTSDADCDTANNGFCGGVCVTSETICGAGAICIENPDPVAGQVQCGAGRCCFPGGNCGRTSLANCNNGSGDWLGVGGIPGSNFVASCTALCPSTENCSGEDFGCPNYASGIAPLGDITRVIGPIAPAACVPLHEVGDDYVLDTAGTGQEFFELTTVRLIWGWNIVGIALNPSRIRLTFYDENGEFVEDTITGQRVGGQLGIRTIIFDERPIIPARGFMTLQVASRFSPFGRHFWAMTDAADVGTNDPNVVWVGSGPTDPSALGLAAGQGTFAFEIVGNPRETAVGACCDTGTGACNAELPWICERQEGFFQGVGTACQACDNRLTVACATDADCKLCIDGENDGNVCVVSQDCPGGTCDTGSCVTVPPACTVSACCDPINGSCLEVLGGQCSDTTACVDDTDCVGIGDGTCQAACPAGTEHAGFGTNCDPNCCVQPNITGGDLCTEAFVHLIHVPPPGSAPVTVTISGDNSNATFGDRLFDELGVPVGTCNGGIHNTESLRGQDRGWWEAFSIDACANVRLDLCCTAERAGEAKTPVWFFMRDACDPCGGATLNDIIGPPLGQVDANRNRGAPFCAGDDLWQTYKSLQPGTYWHNIYSAPTGTFGVYQMHITAVACPEAACCLPTQMCIDGTSDRVVLDVNGFPVTCASDSDCGTGESCGTCSILNEPDCEGIGGFFNGFGDLPDDVDPIVSCSFGACDIGTCCAGPGACRDETVVGTPCDPATPLSCVNRALCDQIGGEFQGGERCDFPAPPCPNCAVQDLNNCQFPPTGDGEISDLSQDPNGMTAADDFVPGGTVIETVCVWGSYMDPTLAFQTPTPFICTGTNPDSFRVRIYQDTGAVEGAIVGLPGALVGERFASALSNPPLVTSGEEPGTDYDTRKGDLQGYNIVLDPPIILPEPDVRYWLEVVAGVDSPEGNTCWWNWAQHDDNGATRDSHAVLGTDLDGYIPGSGRDADFTFCLGISRTEPLPIIPGPETIGACFNCASEACTPRTLQDCGDARGVWKQEQDCDFDPFVVQPGDVCAGGAGAVAAGVGGCDGGAPNGSVDPGEECDDGNTDDTDGCGSDCLLACSLPPSSGGSGAVRVFAGLQAYDNGCADLDGPPIILGEQGAPLPLDQDFWMEYVATCTGRVFANGCPTGNLDGSYDSALAIYFDPTAGQVCDGGDNQGLPCDCGTRADGTAFRLCNDSVLCPDTNPAQGEEPNNRCRQACPCPTGTTAQFGLGQDESCDGIANGGAGRFSDLAVPGECWLVRMAGFFGQDDPGGIGLVDIACVQALCNPSSPMGFDQVVTSGGGKKDSTENRWISIEGGDPGASQAVRVKITAAPSGFEQWVDSVLWVGAPRELSELSGKDDATAPTIRAAELECSLDPLTMFRDWSLEGVVHVHGDAIIPGATYEVQLMDAACPPDDPGSFDPLVARSITTNKWGDVVGVFNLASQTWSAPDGSVGVAGDVVSVLDKFKNAPTAPKKSRSDLQPYKLDLKITIVDVTRTLDAFSGAKFPFAPPDATTPCP